MAKRAELVAAAKDLNVVLGCNPPIDVTKSVETIKEQLMSAGKLLNDDDKIEAATRAVLDELLGTPVGEGDPEVDPEVETEAAAENDGSVEEAGEVEVQARAEPKEKAKAKTPATATPAKGGRGRKATEISFGAFKPVREGSSLHAIMTAAAKGKTIDDIAKAASIRPDQALHRLRHVLARKHGIGFITDSNTGIIKLALPEGKTLNDAVKPLVQAAAK